MQHAAAHIGDVRFLRDQLQRLHEPGCLRHVALDAEAEHAALPLGQILLRQGMVFVCGNGCVPNPIDLGMSVEIRRHLFCVGRMALHAQGQRVAAQPAQKGVLRAHDGADVADHLGAALGGELRRGKVGIHEAVVAFVGDVEALVAMVPLIIEVAAVHDDAAEGSRVAVEIFGRGMDD